MTRHDQPGVRRQQLRDAAQGCFIARGYADTRIDDVAREAGLSKGAVYWHYPSKQALFLDLMTDTCARSAGIFAAELARSRSGGRSAIRAALRASAADTIARPGETPLLLEFWAALPRDPELCELFNRSYGGLRAAWLTLIGRPGQPGARERRRVATQCALLAGALSGLLLQWQADPAAVDLDDAVDLIFELCDRFFRDNRRRRPTRG